MGDETAACLGSNHLAAFAEESADRGCMGDAEPGEPALLGGGPKSPPDDRNGSGAVGVTGAAKEAVPAARPLKAFSNGKKGGCRATR